MKRNRLTLSVDYDFDLVGLVTTMKEYKLAWSVNWALGIRLVKADDIKIEFRNDQVIVVSNFIFGTPNRTIRLLRNKAMPGSSAGQQFLLPEVGNIDYLLMIQGEESLREVEQLHNSLRAIPQLQYRVVLETDSLKNKDNLLFDC